MIDLGWRTVELDDQQRLDVERIAGVDEFLGGMDRGLVHHLHAAGDDAGADDARDAFAGGLDFRKAYHQRTRRFRRPSEARPALCPSSSKVNAQPNAIDPWLYTRCPRANDYTSDSVLPRFPLGPSTDGEIEWGRAPESQCRSRPCALVAPQCRPFLETPEKYPCRYYRALQSGGHR